MAYRGRCMPARSQRYCQPFPTAVTGRAAHYRGLSATPGREGVYVMIDPAASRDLAHLPDGVSARAAVYTDHFAHVSVMRKVLLRMTSWLHYLYLDH